MLLLDRHGFAASRCRAQGCGERVKTCVRLAFVRLKNMFEGRVQAKPLHTIRNRSNYLIADFLIGFRLNGFFNIII
jgi:hypothetical protein